MATSGHFITYLLKHLVPLTVCCFIACAMLPTRSQAAMVTWEFAMAVESEAWTFTFDEDDDIAVRVSFNDQSLPENTTPDRDYATYYLGGDTSNFLITNGTATWNSYENSGFKMIISNSNTPGISWITLYKIHFSDPYNSWTPEWFFRVPVAQTELVNAPLITEPSTFAIVPSALLGDRTDPPIFVNAGGNEYVEFTGGTFRAYVPEPASLTLLGLGAGMALGRRRR